MLALTRVFSPPPGTRSHGCNEGERGLTTCDMGASHACDASATSSGAARVAPRRYDAGGVTAASPDAARRGPMSVLRFCPRCALELTTRPDGGRDRLACPDENCGFVHFGDFSIGCAGVVMREGRALLVQRGWQPFAGSWQLPGGYVEHDEAIAEAVEREVLEEAGIEARVSDVIGFRHSLGGSIGGPSTNLYVVFRLDTEDGREPSFDNDEITGAGFYSLAEMAQMEAVQGLSRWAIEKALATGRGSGLQPESGASSALSRGRPGWRLFGLQPPGGL
ncbi:MAG: NUDIX domain-containing protein [Dehalococcoidia bacterium]|nr:NUDIX domain-containing protein [Dehalococcoidia bacterium]